MTENETGICGNPRRYGEADHQKGRNAAKPGHGDLPLPLAEGVRGARATPGGRKPIPVPSRKREDRVHASIRRSGPATRRVATLLGALLLAGCTSLLSLGPDTSKQRVITLSAEGERIALPPGDALLVAAPDTPAHISGLAVAVQPTPTSVSYLGDMRWSDRPARLFAQLLADRLDGGAQRTVLSGRQVDFPAAFRLVGQLKSFSIVPVRGNAGVTGYTATVVYHAMIIGMPADKLIAQGQCSGDEAAASLAAPAVGIAFNRAANACVTALGPWLRSSLAAMSAEARPAKLGG